MKTGEYHNILNLVETNIILNNQVWYHNFEPYYVSANKDVMLFSNMHISMPPRYSHPSRLPSGDSNYTVSLWVKVKDRSTKHRKLDTSCRVYNPPADARSSDSTSTDCSSGMLDGADTGMVSSWCPDNNGNNGNFLQLDAGTIVQINGVVLQGRADLNNAEYVTKLKFAVSDDSVIWLEVDNGKVYDGTDFVGWQQQKNGNYVII